MPFWKWVVVGLLAIFIIALAFSLLKDVLKFIINGIIMPIVYFVATVIGVVTGRRERRKAKKGEE